MQNLEASTGAFCVRQKAPKKHTERAVPAGQNFRQEIFKVFALLFVFTKSRKIAAEGGGEAAERQKDLIGLVRSCCLCALIRGLQNLEAPCKGTDCHFLRRAKSDQKAHGVCRPGRDKLSAKRKVSKEFNFVSAKLLFGWADSRFAKPRNFPVRETDLFFSLVRKEPKVPQRVATLWTPGDDSNLRSIHGFC